MAVKRVDSEKVFDPVLFIKQTKDAAKLVDQLLLLRKVLICLADDAVKVMEAIKFDSSKSINEFTEAVNKSKKAVSDLDVFEKKRLATLEKLKFANSSRAEALAEVQVQLQEQNKVNKQIVQENAKIVGSYKATSVRLNKLRKEYKDLRIENKKDTKQTDKLKKEINELDKELKDVDASVGQFGREVGNYEDKALSATKTTLAWAAALVGLDAGISGVNNAIEANEESSEKMTRLQAQLGAVINTVQNRTVNAVSAFLNLSKSIISGSANAEDFFEELDKLTGAFDGTIKEIKENADAAEKAAIAQFALTKASRGLHLAVAILNGEIEKQNIIAGDSTESFDRISEAARKATELQVKRAAILQRIGREELRIIEQRIESQSEDANLAALNNERSEKRIELQELQNELDAASLDNQKIIRETTRDRFEQELDFAIDFFDNTKTLLERQIGDEDEAFSIRANNLKRLQILAESSFQSQIDLINAQVGQDINIRELVKLDDERLVRQKLITDFTVTDEITMVRILEVLRERKTVTQDLVDVNKELTESLEDQLIASDEILNNIEATRAAGRIAAESDEAKNRDLRETELRRQADFELDLVKEGSDEAVLIKEQLNNDLAALDRERLEDIEAAAQEQLDAITALANDSFDIFEQELAKRNDARSQAAADQITKQEELIVKLRENASEGTEQSLAFEEARLEKARLKKQRDDEKAAKKQERLALAQTFLNQVAEQSKENPDTAIVEAFKNTFLARKIAQGLSGLYEGTDSVGSTGSETKFSNGRDGYVVRLDEGEKVFNARQSNKLNKLGYSDRDDVINAVEQFAAGNTWAFMPQFQAAQQTTAEPDYSPIIESNNKVIKAIEDNATHSQFDLSGLNEWIETRFKGHTKEIYKIMLEHFRP